MTPLLTWSLGTPEVPLGKMRRFWCVTDERAPTDPNPRLRTKLLCYANAFVMPLSDSQDEPPPSAVPVGDDGDYAWTGWFGESCDHCDTHWSYDTYEVVKWMLLPSVKEATPS